MSSVRRTINWKCISMTAPRRWRTCRRTKRREIEEVAFLEEEKLVHSAALAWLIKERQDVMDANVLVYEQRDELERTIPAKTRERQKLEKYLWQATDKYNGFLVAVRRSW